MTWHYEISRREHDTTIIAHIARMRAGNQSRDLFQSRHILVTRNGALAQLARKFCVDEELSSGRTIGPAVHQRQLATATWLRTGLDEEGADVPKSYLLAACERVLELKKGIVDQVRFAARSLTPEKAHQLELLLTQDRSVQVLMDKTLGASNVVSATNVESLVDAMTETLTTEIRRETDAKLVATSRDAQSRVRKAQEAKRSADKEIADLGNTLNRVAIEDRHIVSHLFADANRSIRMHRIRVKLGVSLIVMVIGALPLLAETVPAPVKTFVLIGSGVIAAILSGFQLLDRPTGIERWTRYFAYKKIARLAADRGAQPKLERYLFEYREGKFDFAKGREEVQNFIEPA
jgi:hypothetical protein